MPSCNRKFAHFTTGFLFLSIPKCPIQIYANQYAPRQQRVNPMRTTC